MLQVENKIFWYWHTLWFPTLNKAANIAGSQNCHAQMPGSRIAMSETEAEIPREVGSPASTEQLPSKQQKMANFSLEKGPSLWHHSREPNAAKSVGQKQQKSQTRQQQLQHQTSKTSSIRSRSVPSKAPPAKSMADPLPSTPPPTDPRASASPRQRRNSGGGAGGCGSGGGCAGLVSALSRRAKEAAESAMREGRVFSVQGPYPWIREFLRRRGWVEKFSGKSSGPTKRARRPRRGGEDDGDDGDGDGDGEIDEENRAPPWEEENGIYGLMSRMMRNYEPTLIWTLRLDQVDYQLLHREQMLNHFTRSACLTTKFGLCQSLRQLPWFDSCSADTFYPRCYVLSSEEERAAFTDDFRITACMSLLRQIGEAGRHEVVIDDGENGSWGGDVDALLPSPSQQQQPLQAKKAGTSKGGHHKSTAKITPSIQYADLGDTADGPAVPPSVLETAIEQCERVLRMRSHDDLDGWDSSSGALTDAEWNEFLQQFYRVAHNGARLAGLSDSNRQRSADLCSRLRPAFPQFDIDGSRCAWVLKPGARSRGRGIECVRTLDAVAAAVGHSVTLESSKLVAQKYIERPMIIHRTKFDIRQWFLVTDFNPLTVWWYGDCYVRFCSQHFTMNDFNESVHLSNNSVQYKYANCQGRHPDLPEDNIWHSDTLKAHLAKIGRPAVYDEVIQPGMQRAVVSCLLCGQDSVEMRKNSFQLFGADFMISDSFQPWLLEINSSPTMSPSTEVTTGLCRNVQEDVLKVLLDHRQDRNCDTGRFFLAFRQAPVDAPAGGAGLDLTLLGQHVRRPQLRRRSDMGAAAAAAAAMAEDHEGGRGSSGGGGGRRQRPLQLPPLATGDSRRKRQPHPPLQPQQQRRRQRPPVPTSASSTGAEAEEEAEAEISACEMTVG